MKKYAERKEIADDVEWCDRILNGLDDSIQKYLWNEDRFVRGICEDGYVVGQRDNEEGSMWLNPQSWAVISGAAREDQAVMAMDKVHELLNTKYGALLFTPSFKVFGLPVARMALMNPGTKENAGIFSQAQGWLLSAECALGHGNRALEYYREFNPASANDDYADIREIEPYAHGQSVEGTESPYFGRGHVHWLTGTASTVIVGMTKGVLGIKPDVDGIRIDPCIPSDWRSFTMSRIWRGKTLNVSVDNSAGVEKGVVRAIVNGKEFDGCFIPESALADKNEIELVMG